MSIDPSDVPQAPPENAPCAPVVACPEALGLLAGRRSSKPFHLADPGPTPGQLEAILRLAARVPDHGKLAPWRFIVFEGAARARAGEALAAIAAGKPGATAETVEASRNAFLQAPMVVAVVSRAAPHPKIPEWEQVLSAGAVCFALLTAAQAMGFGGVWLTGWPTYDEDARASLGLQPEEKLAGLIHLGTQTQAQVERVRPDLGDLVTRY